MITTETPYKLAEIIRDTFPNLYRQAKEPYNTKSLNKNNVRILGGDKQNHR